LIGRSPSDIEVIWEELYNLTRPFGQGGAVVNALSGIDIALWDLLGRTLGQSISRLVGGRFRERVEPYVTGFYRRQHSKFPEDGIAEARQHMADGFRALKLKLGFGVADDIEYVRAVRTTLGPEIRLMADANCAYAVPAAREIMQQTADCRLHFFEEPLAPEDIEGYKLLRGLGIMSLAAGEGLLGKHACCRWISGGALDILQPDICSSGGFTELRKIAAICQCWNTRLNPHVWGSGICLAASLQFLATLPPSPMCLHPMEPLLEYDCSDHPFRSELIFDALPRGPDGWMSIPDGPGLGVEVNREVIDKFASA
jgi:D-galactarolactone cycloisomerase